MDDEIEKANEKHLNQVLDEVKKHPKYYILMFQKMIENHHKTLPLVVPNIKFIHPDLTEIELKKAADYICYKGAYSYLERLNLKDEKHQEFLKEVSTEGLIKTLKSAIEYFSQEDVEEYEKCAYLNTIKEKVLNNVAQLYM